MIEDHSPSVHALAEHHRRIARAEDHHHVQRRASEPRHPRGARAWHWLLAAVLVAAAALLL
jgi:hypothetical protein